MHTILGFDPGTAITGWGSFTYIPTQQFEQINYGCITTPAHESLVNRLELIYNQTQKLINEVKPTAIIIEKLFFNTNAKTAMSVGHARGVLMLASHQSHIPIFEYTPLQIKQTLTGYGRADKKQIQFMVTKILNLKSPPKPDDAADALAGAITHAFTIKK